MTEAAAGKGFWDTYLPPRHRAEAIALAIGLVAVNVLAQYLGRLLTGLVPEAVVHTSLYGTQFIQYGAKAAVVFVAIVLLQYLPRMPRSLWLVIAGSAAVETVLLGLGYVEVLLMPAESGGGPIDLGRFVSVALYALPAVAALLAGFSSAVLLPPPADDPIVALEAVQASELMPPAESVETAPLGERLLPAAFRPLTYGYLAILGVSGVWRFVFGIPLAMVQSRQIRGLSVPDPAVISTLTAASFTGGLFISLFVALKYLRVPRAVWVLFAGPTLLSLVTVPFAMMTSPAPSRAALAQFILSGIMLTLVAIVAALWLGVRGEEDEPHPEEPTSA